ncbi:MAG: hypothetical protein H6719_26400 [Sandaracinaceae bacterium]|nr:hypothetical protein [Sandaracinaceae bacterium]
MRKRTCQWAFLAGFLAACSAHIALAQDEAPTARARQAFEGADAHFENGEYAQALTGYQYAYDLMEGHPNRSLILFNIGRANEELGRSGPAAEAFREFLRLAPSDAPYRDRAEERLRELDLRNQLDRGVQEPAASRPPGAEFNVTPIVLIAVGGAALITGAITGGVALSEDTAIAESCDEAGSCPAELRPRAEAAQTLANVTDALLIGGAAVALTGLVLFFVLTESGDEATASVACAMTGCTTTLRVSF